MPKITTRAAALIATGALALGVFAPSVFAIDGHQSFPATYTDFKVDCSDNQVEPGTGEVYWHFIQTSADPAATTSTALLSIDLTPAGAGGGDLTGIQAYKIVGGENGSTIHWYAILPAGAVVEGISSNVNNAEGKDGNLNVSHVCAGADATATPPAETATPPAETATPPAETATPPAETATPAGTVEGSTSTPGSNPTPTGTISSQVLPSTSTATPAGTSPSGLPIVLVLGIAALAAILLATTPAAKRTRR